MKARVSAARIRTTLSVLTQGTGLPAASAARANGRQSVAREGAKRVAGAAYRP
jgi:hypothetical protein